MQAQTTLLRKIGQIHQALLQININGVLQKNQSPLLKIIRQSDKYYLDFNTNDWVNSGGTNTTILQEIETDGIKQGIYEYVFNPEN